MKTKSLLLNISPICFFDYKIQRNGNGVIVNNKKKGIFLWLIMSVTILSLAFIIPSIYAQRAIVVVLLSVITLLLELLFWLLFPLTQSWDSETQYNITKRDMKVRLKKVVLLFAIAVGLMFVLTIGVLFRRSTPRYGIPTTSNGERTADYLQQNNRYLLGRWNREEENGTIILQFTPDFAIFSKYRDYKWIIKESGDFHLLVSERG